MMTAAGVVVRQRRSRSSIALEVLLVASVVAVGLMAGFFYAYACSVMVGLERVDDRTFITTMQWINATVGNVAFAPAFFGALLLTIAAAGVAVPSRRSGWGWVLTAAGLSAAAFLVTMTLNVPLNEQLAAAGHPEQISDLAAVRAAFEGPWVRWNLLRTTFATGSLIALVIALLAYGRQNPASSGLFHESGRKQYC
jgi:uncharacterized membrane protein